MKLPQGWCQPLNEIFSRIEHSRTADEVVEQIEVLILEGILRVGDKLPGERELARQFEVSRPILRDALKTLEGRGLLVTRHGGGTYVADVIGQVFTGPVMELISKHRKAIADYLEYRREVEGVDPRVHLQDCRHGLACDLSRQEAPWRQQIACHEMQLGRGERSRTATSRGRLGLAGSRTGKG